MSRIRFAFVFGSACAIVFTMFVLLGWLVLSYAGLSIHGWLRFDIIHPLVVGFTFGAYVALVGGDDDSGA